MLKALTCCGFTVSGSLSLPSPGFFSPFPHGTSALSVAVSYLALDRGRPGFRQGFSGLAVLRTPPHGVHTISRTGLSPALAGLPMPFRYRLVFSLHELVHIAPDGTCNTPRATACTLAHAWVWALPRSLAATCGVSFDFFSSGYLDGSVPRVWHLRAYRFSASVTGSLRSGYPIRQFAGLRMCAPHRNFSQLTAAFIAVQLQGIHREPVFA